MSLLPKEHGQFAKEDFWDSFFKNRGDKSFDWYGEYGELSGVIHKYIKPADRILMVGCGNSKLSEDLYDLSFHDIHNIDISEHVIKHMNQRNKEKRPEMTFARMDATQMSFEEESFKSAIDKGTLDALLPDLDHVTIATAMLTDVWRVVKPMGSYIIVSLAQDHVLNTLVNSFQDRPCIFRVHKLPTGDDDGFMMPVFAFAITKLKQIPGMKPIWESSLHEDSNVRHSTSEDMISTIKECQYYAMLQNKLSKGSLGDGSPHPCVRLYSSANSKVPRYTLHIVDSVAMGKTLKFAVFIAPQGKEVDWMFSTDEGRVELASSCGYQRLVVVTLNRAHVYTDLDQVKAELSAKVMELAQPGATERDAPFLSMAEGLGLRNVVHQCHTQTHGTVYVEDVNSEGSTMMRYACCERPESDTPYASAKLLTKRSKKSTEKLIQASELMCESERVVAASVCYTTHRDGQLPDLLIVGLQHCGTLATFISKYMTDIVFKSVTCITADPEMLQIARDYFSLDININIINSSSDTGETVQKLVDQGKQYGCIVTTKSQQAKHYLPLLNDNGLLVVTSSSTETTEQFTADSLSHTLQYNKGDSQVTAMRNSEFNLKDKKVKKLMYRVQEKITSDLNDKRKDKRTSEVDLINELTRLNVSSSQNGNSSAT